MKNIFILFDWWREKISEVELLFGEAIIENAISIDIRI